MCYDIITQHNHKKTFSRTLNTPKNAHWVNWNTYPHIAWNLSNLHNLPISSRDTIEEKKIQRKQNQRALFALSLTTRMCFSFFSRLNAAWILFNSIGSCVENWRRRWWWWWWIRRRHFSHLDLLWTWIIFTKFRLF